MCSAIRSGLENWIGEVQQFRNVFECLVLTIVDQIAPLVEFINNQAKTTIVPKAVRNAINKGW